MLRNLPIALLSCCFLTAVAQPQRPLNPNLVASKWPASWIASPTASPKAAGVFYFRRELILANVPAHYWVHVSADNRFLLHVNGHYAAEGPARGDLFHWRFETIDLAPLLHPGENLLAAVVWNFGESAPVAQMSNRTGFLMQGDTPAEAAVNTGTKWKALREEPGRASLGHNGVREYYAAGPAEKIDGRNSIGAGTSPRRHCRLGYSSDGGPRRDTRGAGRGQQLGTRPGPAAANGTSPCLRWSGGAHQWA